eukprot:GHVU01148856.1.p1 GENE.GHVU01148856.1~~GHVU01148856.1.p1  ORF type:complete len:482 (-),score=37.00 GHVU01148856.1:445-1890(-)
MISLQNNAATGRRGGAGSTSGPPASWGLVRGVPPATVVQAPHVDSDSDSAGENLDYPALHIRPSREWRAPTRRPTSGIITHLPGPARATPPPATGTAAPEAPRAATTAPEAPRAGTAAPEAPRAATGTAAIPSLRPPSSATERTAPAASSSSSSRAAAGTAATRSLRPSSSATATTVPAASASSSSRAARGSPSTSSIPPLNEQERDRRRKDVHRTTVRISLAATTSLPPGVTRPAGNPLAKCWETRERRVADADSRLGVSLTGALRGEFTVDMTALLSSLVAVCGSNFQTRYVSLGPRTKDNFVTRVVELVAKAVLRLRKITQGFRISAPPVFPSQFLSMSCVEFGMCVNEQEDKLRLHYGGEYDRVRDTLMTEHEDMRRDTSVARAADGETFSSNWASCMNDYPHVYELAAGFATVYPGNADVERDFATMKWLYSAQRPNLTIASIVGTVVCRQLRRLRAYKPVADRITITQGEGWETV